MNTANIRALIESSTEPLVFNNLLKWKLLQWNIDKWCECLGDTKLQFRQGQKAATKEPQWEQTCKLMTGTFNHLLHLDENKWLYFDYKYLNQWFLDKFDLRNEINWENIGYENIKAADSTIWIGSAGAHTPCHIDTYGFNLVAQLKGRKLWLLFPPDTDLKATRVPYEESTIYSSINFYSPSEQVASFLQTTNCKKIILEPGQVLFVPNGWWHYVENLELSISINTWIPIAKDYKMRVSEALTLLMTQTLTCGFKMEEQKLLINNTDMSEISTLDAIYLIETSMHNYKANDNHVDLSNAQNNVNISLLSSDLAQVVPNLSNHELQAFLLHQRSRFPGIPKETKMGNEHKVTDALVKKYLSVLTDPDVISLIEQKLLNK